MIYTNPHTSTDTLRNILRYTNTMYTYIDTDIYTYTNTQTKKHRHTHRDKHSQFYVSVRGKNDSNEIDKLVSIHLLLPSRPFPFICSAYYSITVNLYSVITAQTFMLIFYFLLLFSTIFPFFLRSFLDFLPY